MRLPSVRSIQRTERIQKYNSKHYDTIAEAVTLLNSDNIEDRRKAIHLILTTVYKVGSHFNKTDIDTYKQAIIDIFGERSSILGAMRYIIRESFNPKRPNRNCKQWLGFLITLVFYNGWLINEERIIIPQISVIEDVINMFKYDPEYFEYSDGVSNKICLLHPTQNFIKIQIDEQFSKEFFAEHYGRLHNIVRGLQDCKTIMELLEDGIEEFERVAYLFPYEDIYKKLLTLVETTFGSYDEFKKFYKKQRKQEAKRVAREQELRAERLRLQEEERRKEQERLDREWEEWKKQERIRQERYEKIQSRRRLEEKKYVEEHKVVETTPVSISRFSFHTELDRAIKKKRLRIEVLNDVLNNCCDKRTLKKKHKELYDEVFGFDTYGAIKGYPLCFDNLDISDVYSFSAEQLRFLRKEGISI